MATAKLLNHLRRSRPTYYLSALNSQLLINPISEPLSPSSLIRTPHLPPSTISFAAALGSFNWRFLSTRSGYESEIGRPGGFDVDSVTELTELATESEVLNAEFASNGEESILPVDTVISMLDGFHDFTSLPWWIVIASSTLALRVVLLPMLILQLHKLKRIGELFPKLPPPFPPPLSGRSFMDQISLFRKERRAIGCPSFLWLFASISVQLPCFLLWMTTIRRMSLDHHPGFDCGGALWFQNLTEYPHGVLGLIFPLLIAGLHYTNVQISFRRSSVGKESGQFGLLAKYYKLYLDCLTLPLLFVGFCIPQGSLVYWVTNSSLTLVQQISLNHPAVRAKLGLPDKDGPSPRAASDSEKPGTSILTPISRPEKLQQVSVQDLSPKELLALSVQLLSKGLKERAIPLLRLALDKDPEYVRALIVMGQTLLQKGLPAEASEYLERAISKLFHAGHPTELEDIDLLILASQWAGVAYTRQGKNAEGIAHLERVGKIKEPEEAKSKAHYFDGLVLLASALYNEGRRTEAANYLRLAAAYNPAYNEFLEQCENDEDAFLSDLVSSRRVGSSMRRWISLTSRIIPYAFHQQRHINAMYLVDNEIACQFCITLLSSWQRDLAHTNLELTGLVSQDRGPDRSRQLLPVVPPNLCSIRPAIPNPLRGPVLERGSAVPESPSVQKP
ncbi:hypothetical protein FNV43_RR02869 [Rhamnella rubrinervis]|uniref:ALBINO3-like protein 2, chloroplastic n=1 Tax=Rhamnella rubrinervis TaxID=2594499 RepID=A0A8K0MN59_9ROSA|nr:hypothetical protein FNV43_RR02869 [Rhamnella rubrinervis]